MATPPDGSLDGVVVAHTRLAHVDGTAGVALVRGYPLADLARKRSYEDVAHLVLRGELPDAAEHAAFLARAATSASLAPEHARLARALGTALPPGDALTASIALAEDDAARAETEPVRAAERVLSRVPSVVAATFGDDAAVDAGAPYAVRAAAALGATRRDGPGVRALEVLLSLESEHGLSASAFAARVAASSGASLGASLAAACATLSGPRHGGATAEAHALLAGLLARGDDPAAFVTARVAEKARLPGFGHRVYRVADPRVPPLREAMQAMGGARLLPVADAMSARVSELLGSRGVHANVDLYGAAVLDALGVPPPRYAAAFALGVVAGWLAHALEVRAGGRLVRPSSAYDGPPRREVP